jgi:hypothetical protein
MKPIPKDATRRVWITWGNTDYTEGRGTSYPLCISESRACALRHGIGQGIMGSDCGVEPFDAPYIDGRWLFPAYLQSATTADEANDVAYKEQQEALCQLKSMGATDEQIKKLVNYRPI